LETKFDLANNVIQAIHDLAAQDVPYLDAILHYHEKSGIELDVIAEIISKDELIKSKLEIEAEDLHFLKRTNRLPI